MAVDVAPAAEFPLALAPSPPRLPVGRARVLVVDSHELVHLGLRFVLGREDWVERCIGTSTVARAVEFAARYEPHLALIALRVGGHAWPELCSLITRSSPATRVLLLLTGESVPRHIAEAEGVSGVLYKDQPARDIAETVHRALAGDSVFPDGVGHGDLALSERERQVLHRIAVGHTNREIAAELYLSPDTVKFHTKRLYRKLAARNRTDAVQRAQRMGFLA